jgi:hypothetical protein
VLQQTPHHRRQVLAGASLFFFTNKARTRAKLLCFVARATRAAAKQAA